MYTYPEEEQRTVPKYLAPSSNISNTSPPCQDMPHSQNHLPNQQHSSFLPIKISSIQPMTLQRAFVLPQWVRMRRIGSLGNTSHLLTQRHIFSDLDPERERTHARNECIERTLEGVGHARHYVPLAMHLLCHAMPDVSSWRGLGLFLPFFSLSILWLHVVHFLSSFLPLRCAFQFLSLSLSPFSWLRQWGGKICWDLKNDKDKDKEKESGLCDAWCGIHHMAQDL